MVININNWYLVTVNSSPETVRTKAQLVDSLRTADIDVVGQFTWGSNFTFLVELADCGLRAVYKPSQGERPLWDFPPETLAGREVAAYLLSEALGWGLVPPTVYREAGPAGPGSLQLRIEHDPEMHYFTFDGTTRQRLRPTALFDLLLNNADRKGGHILLDSEEHIWLIDHGICFHAEPKLRTVVWDFVGEQFPEKLAADMRALAPRLAAGGLRVDLLDYLASAELEAMQQRLERLLTDRRYPAPPEDQRAVPWPPV